MKRNPLHKKAKAHSQPWYRRKCVERAKQKAKERDNYICNKCSKDGKQGYQMHGAHVHSEGHYHGMSDHLPNIMCLCAQCHMWWHENPREATKWFETKYPKRARELTLMTRQTIQKDWKVLLESVVGVIHISY